MSNSCAWYTERMAKQPYRDIVLVIFVILALAGNYVMPQFSLILFFIAFIGALPTAFNALYALKKLRITIDTFNLFALVVSFAAREFRSAAFIVLMLSFARILNWYTETRAHSAIQELLKLKPASAIRERDSKLEEIPADNVHNEDILLVKEGSRIPVDGLVLSGKASINESAVTGESMPVEKIPGDSVLSSTLNESGTIKIRATRVGANSTIQRMAGLIREASANKSHAEKIADRFAAFFLPLVLLLGLFVYLWTRNVLMTASLFLVACADDMAVAIPLAITAAIGKAAKRGVVIKGGDWLETIANTKTIVLDKTGTLTYGSFNVASAALELFQRMPFGKWPRLPKNGPSIPWGERYFTKR